MCNVKDIETIIKQMIDRLKAISANKGLGNTADEERIITTIFLYKFLNDQFMHNIKEFAEEVGMTIDEIWSDDDILAALYDKYAGVVAFRKEETISYLVGKLNDNEFYKLFDSTLENISSSDRNKDFAIENADGTKEGLFKGITSSVDSGDRASFAREIFGVISNESFNFENVFTENFDFFASIFEYLIKDYNKASGKYAEYFTPQTCARIMAQILTHGDENKGAEIYDPSAGSGTLIMHLAHALGQEKGTNKALVYTQDISQKSSRFLRINLLLNGLTESLHNIRKGDTLLNPAHFQVETNPSSGLRRYDYIVSNPPFKMDFSDTRDSIETRNKETDRFFAGLPNIPNKDVDKMPVYLLFIQHIIFSLKDNGRAAFVVPTGFLTAKGTIEKKIRQHILDEKMLKGVVSMPSNIFATTGTKVSIIFLEKNKSNEKIMFVDASLLGQKIKDGKIQKTVLSADDTDYIKNTFINCDDKKDFSICVDYDDIKDASLSPNQYFPVELEYTDLTKDQFTEKINSYATQLKNLDEQIQSLSSEVQKKLRELNYEQKQ